MEIYKLYKKTQKATWEVSNYGNVKMNGNPYECRISCGYKRFGRGVYLHKAVAELFIPNPDNKPHIDHIDTNKLNNNVNNLRWCTQKENNNNMLTLQHYSEAQKITQNRPEIKQKKSEVMTGEKHPLAKKCVYNGIEFGCIKDAWHYAVKNCGYECGYSMFREHIKG